MRSRGANSEEVRGQTSGLSYRKRHWLLLIAALVIGCSPDDVTSPAPQLDVRGRGHSFGASATVAGRLVACEQREAIADSALIGPAGGTLRVGNNELVVPPGALLETVMLRGEIPADTIASIRLYPEGLTFHRAAGLVLDAQGCADPEGAPKILYLDDAGNILEEIDAYYTPWWKRVAAPIDHFSRYALGV